LKKKQIIALLAACVLLGVLTSHIAAREIEGLVTLFISDPARGMEKVLKLVKTNSQAVALVLAEVAERAVELRAEDPELAIQLENYILFTCMYLIDVDPSAAALAVVTIKERAPDIGRRIETVVVAQGLEQRYLRAASPVHP